MGSSKIKSKLYLIPEGKNWDKLQSLPDIRVSQASGPKELAWVVLYLQLCSDQHTQLYTGQLPITPPLAPGSQPTAVASVLCRGLRGNRDGPHSKPSTAFPG